MHIADLGDVGLHYRIDGDPDGAPLVFANSLGTDMRLWDLILPHLPKGLRIIRFDKRGHGLSSQPPGPYSMGSLVRDAERLLDHLAVRDCVFVGLSIGGMIAQGLAVKRMDQVRALVLSNTAAKIGNTCNLAEPDRRCAGRRYRGAGRCHDGALVFETLPYKPRNGPVAHYDGATTAGGLPGMLRRDFRNGLLHPHQRVTPAYPWDCR